MAGFYFVKKNKINSIYNLHLKTIKIILGGKCKIKMYNNPVALVCTLFNNWDQGNVQNKLKIDSN